jgi:hypothetical protein
MQRQKLPENEKARTIQPMNGATHLEHSASSSRGKHEGDPSFALCDRLSRTRGNSQRQLPTDHDYAVPTREYQTDQSSLKPAPAAARSVLGKQQKQRQKQTHRSRGVDTITPYQDNALVDPAPRLHNHYPFRSLVPRNILYKERRSRVPGGKLLRPTCRGVICVGE